MRADLLRAYGCEKERNMNSRFSRRKLIEAAGVAAFAAPAVHAAKMPEPRFEGKDSPKLSLGMGDGGGGAPGSNEAGLKRIKQLGVDYVLGGGPRIPWEESRLKEQMDRIKAAGLTLGNLMIGGFDNAIYNRPGKDEEIEKVIQSIRAAGKVGLPVVEYNWYAHRAMEGYFEETGRAGVGWTGFDYERPVDENGTKIPFKDLPPRPN